MLANFAAPDLLKMNVFWSKIYNAMILSITLPTKFFHVPEIILYMWSYDQRLVTLAFLWEQLS